MEFLLNTAKLLERLNTRVAKISVWLLLALMLVIVTDVTLRRWFVIGSTKLQELEWHLHGALFLLCLGWAYTKNAHVRIELLSEKFSPKGAAVVELCGCLLFLLPYVIAVLMFGFDYAVFSWEYGEASASATGLPHRWVIKSTILIGFALLGLAALARLFESIVFLFGSKRQADATFFAQKSTASTGAV